MQFASAELPPENTDRSALPESAEFRISEQSAPVAGPVSPSLRDRLLKLIAVVLAVTLAAFGIGAVYYVWATDQQAWLGRQTEATNRAVSLISTYTEFSQKLLVTLGSIESQILGDHPEVLAEVVTHNPGLLEMARFDSRGNMTAAIDVDEDERPPGNPYTTLQSAWFAAAQSGRSYLSSVELDANGNPYVLMAVPTSDGGAMMARVDARLLWDQILQLQIGETGQAYLVNRRGLIMASPNPEMVLRRTRLPTDSALSRALQVGTTRWQGQYTNYQGTTVQGIAASIPGTNMVVITEIAIVEIQRNTWVAIVVMGLSAAGLTLAARRVLNHGMERWILRRLDQVRQGAQRIGRGELNHQIVSDVGDEIGALADAFNDMAGRLSERERRLIEEVDSHRQTEDALRRSETAQRLLLEALPDALFRFSPDGIFLGFKPSNEVMPLVPPEAFLGQPVRAVLPPERAQQTLDGIQYVLDHNLPIMYEYQLMTDGVMRDFESRLVPGADQDVIAIVRDITDRRRREQQLEEALAQERLSSEMQARFVTLMSHEFRTPLAIINTAMHLLKHFPDRMSSEQREARFGVVSDQVTRLARMLEDFLLLSKGEALKTEIETKSQRLDLLCQDLVREFGQHYPAHRIDMEMKGQTGRTVAMDGSLMKRALSNLLENAVKYSSEGSRVRLELEMGTSLALLRVIDEGIGIPETEQSQIFTPFFRGSNTGHSPGIGLGLVIARQIVEAHDGNLTFSSTDGNGSEFTIALPIRAE